MRRRHNVRPKVKHPARSVSLHFDVLEARAFPGELLGPLGLSLWGLSLAPFDRPLAALLQGPGADSSSVAITGAPDRGGRAEEWLNALPSFTAPSAFWPFPAPGPQKDPATLTLGRFSRGDNDARLDDEPADLQRLAGIDDPLVPALHAGPFAVPPAADAGRVTQRSADSGSAEGGSFGGDPQSAAPGGADQAEPVGMGPGGLVTTGWGGLPPADQATWEALAASGPRGTGPAEENVTFSSVSAAGAVGAVSAASAPAPSRPPRTLPPRRPPRRSADPLWVLDANDALVVTPGVVEHEFSTWQVDLRAQVSGGTVLTYSWDLSGAPDATNVSGQSTYRLQFTWADFTGPARTNTITVTTTNTDLTQEVQTLTFSVIGRDSPAWASAPPTTAATWPTVVQPDQLTAEHEAVGGPYYQLVSATGALEVGHILPAYNPGVPPLGLVYSSTAADPRPVFVVRYTLDPARASAPPQVSARLTLNGAAGQEVYYNTALLNPGDVMQIALQADATGLATGRYDYRIDVTAYYGVPASVSYSGRVNIVNPGSGVFGQGWALGSLQRLWPVYNGPTLEGAILELPGGLSLWFAAQAGTGSFTAPPGDFSTLVRNGDGTYTRTLKGGGKINFDANGRQASAVDRNGNVLRFDYDGAGRLTTITDPNSLATALAYQNGLVRTITDPAGRVTTLSYAAGRLDSITDPDPDGTGPLPAPVTGFQYNGAGRMTRLTNPRSFPTTFTYNFAGRVESVDRPDGTTERLTALQMRGLAAPGSGTAGNPAPAVLAAEAQADYTDGETNLWQSRLDWLGFGRPAQQANPLAQVAVAHRDANGLPWLTADPLGRRTRYLFSSKGNPTQITLPDDKTHQFVYNEFSLATRYTDPNGNVTTYTHDQFNGNLNSITWPDPDGPGGPLPSPVTNFSYYGDGWVKTITDPLGHTTTFTRDGRDRITQITYPDDDTDPANNPAVVLGYDAASNLTSRQDERGFTTTFQYDNLNRITGLTLPDDDTDPDNNPRYAFEYDAAGNRTSLTNPLGKVTGFSYDPLDRLWTVTDPLSHTTAFGYDNVGNLRTVTDPLSHTTTFSYDGANRLAGITNALSKTTIFSLDAAGQRTGVTDPLQHTTIFSYDLRGRLVSVTDPLLNRTDYGYDANGNRTTLTEVSVTPGPERSVSRAYGYDGLNRLVRYTDQLGNVTSFAYDAANNLLSETRPDPDGGGPLVPPVSRFTYDARDRLETAADPLNKTTTFGYDAAGNRTSITDPLLRATTFGYDAQDRLCVVTQPDPDDGGPLPNPVSHFAYDPAGRLESFTDPLNNLTGYGYDDADRLTTVTDPRGKTTIFGYDNANRQTGVTDRNGRRRAFGYDDADRLTTETWLDAAGNPVRTITYDFDDADRLTGARDPDSAYAYGYDDADRLTSVDNLGTPGVPRVVLTYGYDGFNRLTSLGDNLQGSITYGYDDAHRLTGASLVVSGVQGPQVALGYDPLDRLTGITRKVAAGGPTITSSLGYDADDRLTGLTHTSSAAGQLAAYGYGYDDAGQLTSSTGPEGSLAYGYDRTGQLTGVSGARTETYTYDVNGNRRVGYTTDTGNRLTGDGVYNYEYDEEGNLTCKTRISDG